MFQLIYVDLFIYLFIAFGGLGGFGSVFCRASSPGCRQVIKIPLDNNLADFTLIEKDLAKLYTKHGKRAARTIPYYQSSSGIIIKEFV